MSEFYSFDGLRHGGTFIVDATTKTAIASNPKAIEGKVVTVTGNCMAGYGSAGDPVLGVVEKVEHESTNSADYVVSVRWGMTVEDIACVGSETAGDFLSADGKGGVKASTDPTNCMALSVDGTAKLAIIKIV